MMNTLSAVLLVFAVSSQSFARDLGLSNLVPNTSELPYEAAPQQQLQNTVNTAFDFLKSSTIQSEEDVNNVINQLKSVTDNVYDVELQNLQTWSQNNLLAPYLNSAEGGLSIARDQLKNIAQSVGDEALQQIEQARSSGDPNQLAQVFEDVQQRMKDQMEKPLQYFQDAAQAIGLLAEKITGQQTKLPNNLQIMKSGRSTSIPEIPELPNINVPMNSVRSTNIPQIPELPQISAPENSIPSTNIPQINTL